MQLKKKLLKGGGSFNMNLILLVGGMVLLVGIIYMVVDMSNSSNSTEQSTTPKKNSEQFTSGETRVVFHKMEGCGHCVKFEPVWKQALTELPKNISSKMEIKAPGDALEKEYPVNGYPTIRVYKDGKMVEMTGERTLSAFKKFVTDNV